VLAAATPEVEGQLHAARDRFEAAVATFLAEYPRWHAAMAPEWDAAARAAWVTSGRLSDQMAFVTAFRERVEAAYPRASALARKFEFFWWTYRLELGGLERIELAVAAEAERARRERDAALSPGSRGPDRHRPRAEPGWLPGPGRPGLPGGADPYPVGPAPARRDGRAPPADDPPVPRPEPVRDDALEREIGAFEQACLEGLDPAAVSRTPELQALWAEGLGAVVKAATADLPRSELTGRLLRRFDVDPEPPDRAEPRATAA
jgi:hypothetical protein